MEGSGAPHLQIDEGRGIHDGERQLTGRGEGGQ